MTDILTLIDRAIGCQHCGKPLGASPSDDFCSEEHQAAWHAARAEPIPAGPPEQCGSVAPRRRPPVGPWGPTIYVRRWI